MSQTLSNFRKRDNAWGLSLKKQQHALRSYEREVSNKMASTSDGFFPRLDSRDAGRATRSRGRSDRMLERKRDSEKQKSSTQRYASLFAPNSNGANRHNNGTHNVSTGSLGIGGDRFSTSDRFSRTTLNFGATANNSIMNSKNNSVEFQRYVEAPPLGGGSLDLPPTGDDFVKTLFDAHNNSPSRMTHKYSPTKEDLHNAFKDVQEWHRDEVPPFPLNGDDAIKNTKQMLNESKLAFGMTRRHSGPVVNNENNKSSEMAKRSGTPARSKSKAEAMQQLETMKEGIGRKKIEEVEKKIDEKRQSAMAKTMEKQMEDDMKKSMEWAQKFSKDTAMFGMSIRQGGKEIYSSPNSRQASVSRQRARDERDSRRNAGVSRESPNKHDAVNNDNKPSSRKRSRIELPKIESSEDGSANDGKDQDYYASGTFYDDKKNSRNHTASGLKRHYAIARKENGSYDSSKPASRVGSLHSQIADRLSSPPDTIIFLRIENQMSG